IGRIECRIAGGKRHRSGCSPPLLDPTLAGNCMAPLLARIPPACGDTDVCGLACRLHPYARWQSIPAGHRWRGSFGRSGHSTDCLVLGTGGHRTPLARRELAVDNWTIQRLEGGRSCLLACVLLMRWPGANSAAGLPSPVNWRASVDTEPSKLRSPTA